jgi:hypothetical protein
MSSVLKINGDSFDVDRFLIETGLVPYLHYRTGAEIGFKKR